MEHVSRSWSGGRWVIGGFLIALGVVFMLMNFDIIDRFPLWKFWPLILVVVGLNKLNEPYHRAEGFWLIALGLWFQWNTLRIMDYGWRDTWPVALILLGLYWMFESFEKESRRKKAQETLNATPNT
jgi:hypothetical protein